jgi:uncharacterized protein YdhG (YjbR/CyaY superfamily)
MADKYSSVDAYIGAQSGIGRTMAESLHTIVARAVPDMAEAIKYNMPAFQIAGKSFLYMAVWKKHIGMYPVYRGDKDFEKTVAPYRDGKDTVRFLFDQPLPEEVVTLVAVTQALRIIA